MTDKNEYYREEVERYCHIIGRNTTFNKYSSGKECYFECAGCEECEKNGGCKHHLFSKQLEQKKKAE